EPAETSPESAARVLLGFGQQHRRASGPPPWLLPSGVIRGAKTRGGRAPVLRTRTREGNAGASSARLPFVWRKPPSDQGAAAKNAHNVVASSWRPGSDRD